MTTGGTTSTAGFFKALFLGQPELLSSSNEVILGMWRAAHPGQPVTKSIRDGLSNTKAAVRKTMTGRKAKRRRGGAVTSQGNGSGAGLATGTTWPGTGGKTVRGIPAAVHNVTIPISRAGVMAGRKLLDGIEAVCVAGGGG